MLLAVRGVVTSIAVTGTRWIVAPITGRPAYAATWPLNSAPLLACRVGLVAAVRRTISIAAVDVSTNITNQMRLEALFCHISLVSLITLLAQHLAKRGKR